MKAIKTICLIAKLIFIKKDWKYIKALCKDPIGVTYLTVDDKALHNPKEKAEILNNQFYSVFKKGKPE